MQENDKPKIVDAEPVANAQGPLNADENPVVATKKSSFSKLINSITLFFKKFKWIIIGVLIAAIALVIFLYNFVAIIPVDNIKLVNLNTRVRIEMGQTISTKGQNVSVKVLHFTNESCPAGQKCYGPKELKSVEYEITVDGKSYATGSISKIIKSDYNIETLESDYKSYADIQIVKVSR